MTHKILTKEQIENMRLSEIKEIARKPHIYLFDIPEVGDIQLEEIIDRHLTNSTLHNIGD